MLCLALYNVFIIIELSPFISIRGKRSLSNCEGPGNHTELFTDSKGFPWAAYACPENREVCGVLRQEMEAQREDVMRGLERQGSVPRMLLAGTYPHSCGNCHHALSSICGTQSPFQKWAIWSQSWDSSEVLGILFSFQQQRQCYSGQKIMEPQ